MTITGYISENFVLLVLLAGMRILLCSDTHLEKRMVSRFALTNGMILLYSIFYYMETYLGNQEEYTILRPILSATCYSLIAFILVNVIMIVYPMQKAYLFFPAVLNAALCFISIPTGIVFSISKENHFARGPLGYLTYFIVGLYIVYLICNLFKSNIVRKEELATILIMTVTMAVCFLFPLITDRSVQWLSITIALDLMIYYIFLLQQYTKRDPLTGLFNRQSAHSYSIKYGIAVTAVVAMDMNGLKELNDKNGHAAGDKALKELGGCFFRSLKRGQRAYRIGGDEFLILCIGNDEKEVQALVERIRQEVAKTLYTCSIGYSMRSEGSTVETMYKLADKALYEEKAQFYIKSGKDRRKRQIS